MPAGRPPKPTALKLLEGNPGHRPIGGDPMWREPTPESGIPEPPEHLDDRAKEIWFRLCDQLSKMGILTKADREVLALTCDTWSQYLQADAVLKKSGIIVKAPTGFPIQNPALSIANKAKAQLKVFLTELGLTPAARTKLRVPTGQGELPLGVGPGPARDESPLEKILRLNRTA